jgi:hypothetical protein
LADQPGAKVVDSKDRNGDEIRNVELLSGVSFRLHRHGDKVTSVGNDHTGKGAVQCMWGIYISIRSYLKVCSGATDDALVTGLDTAIERINEFIIENSLIPVTRADLEGAILLQEQRGARELIGVPKEEIQRKCMAAQSSPAHSKLRSYIKDDLDGKINNLLSVKRPPVMNPCL